MAIPVIPILACYCKDMLVIDNRTGKSFNFSKIALQFHPTHYISLFTEENFLFNAKHIKNLAWPQNSNLKPTSIAFFGLFSYGMLFELLKSTTLRYGERLRFFWESLPNPSQVQLASPIKLYADDTYDDNASQYVSGSHETSFIKISLLMAIISVLYEMP